MQRPNGREVRFFEDLKCDVLSLSLEPFKEALLRWVLPFSEKLPSSRVSPWGGGGAAPSLPVKLIESPGRCPAQIKEPPRWSPTLARKGGRGRSCYEPSRLPEPEAARHCPASTRSSPQRLRRRREPSGAPRRGDGRGKGAMTPSGRGGSQRGKEVGQRRGGREGEGEGARGRGWGWGTLLGRRGRPGNLPPQHLCPRSELIKHQEKFMNGFTGDV